jgi:hypothetical protein
MHQDASRFRLMGLEPSPYTIKVESFLKFKGIPYDWVSRSLKNEKLFQKHANLNISRVTRFDGLSAETSGAVFPDLFFAQ